MTKKITFTIQYQNTDGTYGTCDPSFWTGDKNALIDRLEKTPKELWNDDGSKTEVFSKVAFLTVTRTIVENVFEYGERIKGNQVKVGTSVFMVKGDDLNKIEMFIKSLASQDKSGVTKGTNHD